MRNNPPHVWLFTDGKPGHQNQLRGLADRLTTHIGAECHWLKVGRPGPSLWQLWRGNNPAPHLPEPDLMIAAGSATQTHLLAATRALSCPAVVLMRPNFPYQWLDGAIVPAHDKPPARPDILTTQGVLNAVVPVQQVPQTHAGLILLGGPSHHYRWDSAAVVAQVQQISRTQPGWHWTVADSRRTPEDVFQTLAALNDSSLTLVSHHTTAPDWLPARLVTSSKIWVSPDSVSMVYEALTSGVPTGILRLAPASTGRVVAGIDALVNAGQLQQFGEPAAERPHMPLWEAERAALWLIDRFSLR